MITLIMLSTLTACIVALSICAVVITRTTSRETSDIAAGVAFWIVVMMLSVVVVWSLYYQHYCFNVEAGYGCAKVDVTELLG